MMQGFFPIFFLLVILKIPVFAALWLVWWASREPEPEGFEEGGEDRFRRFRPQPKGPDASRRGPHGGGAAKPLPPCPPGGRTRIVRPTGLPAYARGGSRADRGGSPPRSCDA